MNEIEQRAYEFAKRAHADQKRKCTGGPYVEHPVEVANLVRRVSHTSEMVCAAFLHDVVEDTETSLDTVRSEFGDVVVKLVEELTDVSRPEDGSRAERKAIDPIHIAKASPEAQTIKLADIISNTRSITQHDLEFAATYIPEKRRTISLLGGDDHLWKLANSLVEYGSLVVQAETARKDATNSYKAMMNRRPYEARKARPVIG